MKLPIVLLLPFFGTIKLKSLISNAFKDKFLTQVEKVTLDLGLHTGYNLGGINA